MTVDAVGRPGQRVEPLRSDRAAAANAGAVCPVVEPGESRVDRGEMLLVALAQGQVALLLEDLAGGGRLRPVGHRVRRDDPLGDSGSEPGALDKEGGPRVLEEWIGHDRIVPVT